MGDLNIFEIPLGDITLEKLDVTNEKHLKAIDTMRDYTAMEMCYDVQIDVNSAVAGREENSFLAKNSDGYFGYVNISDDREGDRILCYIVQEKLRGKGLGKIMLTSVSDYLINSSLASSVKLYINKKNLAGIGLAVSCGFEREGIVNTDMINYSKKK